MTTLRRMLFALLGLGALPAQADSLAGLEDWIEVERKRWGVPGLALAIVHQDQVLHLDRRPRRQRRATAPGD